MNQALVTIVAQLDPARLSDAQTEIDALGNPARPDIAEKLSRLDGDCGIHFVSLHALPSFTAGKAHIVLEFSSDGDEETAIAWLAGAVGPELEPVFRFARDWRGGKIGDYLAGHAIKTGFGIGANPGLGHSGAPGMTVGQIRAEAALYGEVSQLLAGQGGGMSALDRLDDVRTTLAATHGDMLKPAEPSAPAAQTGISGTIVAGIGAFVRTYLAWPVGIVQAVLWAGGMAWICHRAVSLTALVHTEGIAAAPPHERWWLDPQHASAWRVALHLIGAGLALAIKLVVVSFLVLLVIAAILYVRFRSQESSDSVSERAPDPAVLREILARENHPGYSHNHMLSLTQRKPGWLRYFTNRLIFFAIAVIAPRLYRPGYLGSIGTIHFARWITVPGTRDLIFLSNYGGSWESYLEDFITLAHNGLTGVWSNTVGFPKSTNLVNDGATDGERFKRYARQSMLPTRFWYSAYPALNTDMIRVNADVRRGLSGAMTEDDAALWLSRFGSALRPESKLVSSEIQSLLFGGLGFLRFSAATFWTLSGHVAEARAWLAEVAPHVAWSDGRRFKEDNRDCAIVQLGLAAGGLMALGLPHDGMASFPPAFQSGMVTRARILGDTGGNQYDNWWWRETADAVLLVYGESENALAALRTKLEILAKAHGAALVHEIALREIPERKLSKPGAPLHDFDPEPFGFADGISQPLIAGTYKAEREEAHPLHIVAPGEFVLGYADNRGNLPPGPCMSAIHDPANILPIANPDPSFLTNDVNQLRDLGRNGSFLVVRQLEQDVDGFHKFCAAEASRLNKAKRLGPPYSVTPKFIGAKMVGRWQNGAPLVRSQYSQSMADTIIEENGFLMGLEDPEGLRCPFGAHIRRGNPRDSLNPGSDDQIEISNRHRIIRVGRKYEPSADQNPGILFMCLNGDIERQFEFVQQTWINGNVISLSCPMNLAGERDPLLSDGESDAGFTIPTRDGPVKLGQMPQFVTMRGGGYFFMPGKRLIRFLSSV